MRPSLSIFRLSLLLISAAHIVPAQNAATDLHAKLIGRPLYLRDAWQEDTLDFDAHGRPTTEAHRGPVTLSGVDVTSLKLHGSTLEIRGRRVALIARDPGKPLARETAIGSTTTIVPALLPSNRHYHAPEEVRFTVHAGPQGSFTAALDTIFADGLAHLAKSVPPFWRCYAASYFVDGAISPTAADDVEHCAEAQTTAAHPPNDAAPGLTPASILQRVDPHYTNAAAQLRLSGISRVYLTVQPDGTRANFQVIHPLGAGLDEETLQASARSTFRPATQNGQPVAAGLFFEIQYNAR